MNKLIFKIFILNMHYIMSPVQGTKRFCAHYPGSKTLNGRVFTEDDCDLL
jgi:hypothetical protein